MRRGVHGDCAVLNAKNDEYEAGIIALAGKLNAITISTNMAGRGTDIRLGGADKNEKKQVTALGGLYVIGTNRHESKRIDNQLRGRAGRQGDPGSSRFFIRMEDYIFIKYRLTDLLPINMLQDNQLRASIGRNKLLEICRSISLHFIDKRWSQYLDEIADIREGIHLTRLGHQDPLFEFHKLVIKIFDNLHKEERFAGLFDDKLRGQNLLLALTHMQCIS